MRYRTYAEYLAHPMFLDSVKAARKRAGGHCERCRMELPTEPHHIRYCRWGDFDPPGNLEMLCRTCHEDAHRCAECGRINLKAREIKMGAKTCEGCRLEKMTKR